MSNIYWILDQIQHISYIFLISIFYIQYNNLYIYTTKYIYKLFLDKSKNKLNINKNKGIQPIIYTKILTYQGLKINIDVYKSNLLSINLNTTHFIILKLPSEINYLLNKDKKLLILTSYNKELLTLIGNKILQLYNKNKNIYTNIGFFFKN